MQTAIEICISDLRINAQVRNIISSLFACYKLDDKY